MKTNINKPNRLYSLDLLRIIAAMCVVMLHVCAPLTIGAPRDSLAFVACSVFQALVRMAVPLFVLISGSLMLDESREVSLKSIFKNKIVTIALLFVFWSLLYAAYFQIIDPFIHSKPISIKAFIVQLVAGHYHLWYLYMTIGLYLVTPILRCFVKKENKNVILYAIILSLLFNFSIPTINCFSHRFPFLLTLTQFINKFELDFIGTYITYYLLGWYLVHVGINKNLKKFLYVFSLLAFSALFVLTMMFPEHYTEIYSNSNIFVAAAAIGTFVFVNSIYKGSEKSHKIIKYTSSLTFGVYVIHDFVLKFYPFDLSGNAFVYIIVKWLICTSVSFALVFIISKIPVLKKIIRG